MARQPKVLSAWLSTLLAALTVLLVYVLAVAVMVVSPRHVSPTSADAIVTLAPQSERYPAARELNERGLGTTLLISRDASTESLCETVDSRTVICIEPAWQTTLGEALDVNAIAENRDWQSVIVVTSQYHAFRTEYIFRRCLAPNTLVTVVPVEEKIGLAGWVFHIAYESAALIKAMVETNMYCSAANP